MHREFSILIETNLNVTGYWINLNENLNVFPLLFEIISIN